MAGLHTHMAMVAKTLKYFKVIILIGKIICRKSQFLILGYVNSDIPHLSNLVFE